MNGRRIRLAAANGCGVSSAWERSRTRRPGHRRQPNHGQPGRRGRTARAPDDPAGAERLRNTFRRYCLGCHNDRTLTAGAVAAERGPAADRRARSRAREGVPEAPGGRDATGRPPRAPTADTIAGPEQRGSRPRSTARPPPTPNPGAPAIHRLNRAEYRNAVRDLLGLDLDHAPRPARGRFRLRVRQHRRRAGPSRRCTSSSTSRLHGASSRLAVGSLTPRAGWSNATSRPTETTDEAIEGLPPQRAGAGILFRHYFAFDADYTFTVRVRGRRTTGNAGAPPGRSASTAGGSG